MKKISDVQIITDSKGVPTFAVIPWAEYQRLCRANDLQEIPKVPVDNTTTLPLDVTRRIAASGEHRLKVLREWRGITQSELGARANVTSQYISAIESRAHNMGQRVAQKL